MKTLILTLTLTALVNAVPVSRQKRHHLHPQVYTVHEPVYTIQEPVHAIHEPVHVVSHSVHAFQQPAYRISEPVYTVRQLPAQTHVRTHVSTAASTVHTVSVPITYTYAIEQPEYRHTQYDNFYQEPGVWYNKNHGW